MFNATPGPGVWSTSCPWLVLVLWFCVATTGCSPRNTAADGASVEDAAADAGFDVAADGLDSAEVSLVDAVLDVGDAITDVIEADDGVDVAQVDIETADDGSAAVDAGAQCTATEIPAPLTGTVEFDFSPLVPNPVVMGCGKGAPKSVKVGAPCCGCPPPYSCYCNGECGWLRAPDLVKPQHDGQAVWTGKWVVSTGQAYGLNEPGPTTMHVQKWQPGAGKGFELVPLPAAWFKDGHPKLFPWGKSVVIAAAHSINSAWSSEYSPVQPIFLFDPETNGFTEIAMPTCSKLLFSAGTLICSVPGDSAVKGSNPGLQVYNAATAKWELAQPPAALVPKDWYVQVPWFVVTDDDAVYLVDALRSMYPWPDGTNGFPAGPGHILKYEVKTEAWSDIGLVPEALRSDQGWFVRSMDHVGIVLLKKSIQAARFRLDTFKWEVGPKVNYSEGGLEPVLTPCGLLFGDGTLWGGSETGGMKYRPMLLGPDLSWKLLSPWGYPNDAVTSRKGPNTVVTDKEVFALGGFDGPPEGDFVYHKDSYRFPLSALCNIGGSK